MKKVNLICFVCILFDQLIKLLVINTLILNEQNILINNFFSLTYVRNYGAAWSILSGNRLFLILIAIVALILLYKYILKNNNLNRLDILTYGLLLGGIMGNLIDRVVFGYVIDYLDFYIFSYDFPIFNLADTFIVISVFLIIISLIRGEKNGVNR